MPRACFDKPLENKDSQMNSLWLQPQQQQPLPHQSRHIQIPSQAQYLGIDIELDQGVCSEPGSVPLPNEDFEPFLTDYTAYDERLQSTLNRVQDLGISENDHYESLNNVPPQEIPFSMHRQLKYNSFDYYEPEPTIENTWSSPRKNPPMPEIWSSPIKPAHISFHDEPHPQSSPVRNRNRTPVFQNGPSPEFFSPKTPALHDNRQLFSPSNAPPMMDLPSSPPGSPYMRPTFRPAPQLTGVDSLGIIDTASHHIHQHQHQQEIVDVKTESDEAFQWEPVLTIPVEVHRESDRIIRSQRSMGELKTKRKSCLPPGTVDEFISGPDDGTYKCLYPHCGRLFRRKYNLKSHIQTHLCDRPYICDSCDASFVRPHDLKRHELCHKTTRQFVCPCGKGFTRMDAMQRHKARMICDGGVAGGSPLKSPRKRRAKPTNSSSPSDTDSSEGDSSPVLF